MSSITVLFLLCLSVLACNARSLKDSAGKQGQYLFNKDADKAKLHLHETQIHQIELLGHTVLLTEFQKEIDKNTMREEESKAIPKEEAASKNATSGDHIIVPHQNDLQWRAIIEVLHSSQEQARSLLGSSQDDTDEAVDSKENDFAEDTVVMDYAEPHRKPPIHNEKP